MVGHGHGCYAGHSNHEKSMAIIVMAMVVLTAVMTVTVVIDNQFEVLGAFISKNVVLLSVPCLLKMTSY